MKKLFSAIIVSVLFFTSATQILACTITVSPNQFYVGKPKNATITIVNNDTTSFDKISFATDAIFSISNRVIPEGWEYHPTTYFGTFLSNYINPLNTGETLSFTSDITASPTSPSQQIPFYAGMLTNTDGSGPQCYTHIYNLGYQPPIFSTLTGATLIEGETYNEAGSFEWAYPEYNVSPEDWNAKVEYGDGSGSQPLELLGTNTNRTFNLNHTYTTPGTYLVSISVVKNTGDVRADGIKNIFVHVNQNPNQAPIIEEIHDTTVFRGNYYNETGSFTDNDNSTNWTATVDYGDGFGVEPLPLNPDKTFELNHEYNTADEYTLTVVVTDNQGASDTESATVTVIVPDPVTTTFNSSADNYVRSGAPHRNHGAVDFMRLQASGDNRSLVRFDQGAMQTEIGNKEVLSAKLRVTITNGGTGWGTTGRTIDLHRLIADWSEGNGTENDQGTGFGSTWSCATDSKIDNSSKNCNGTTEWEMGQPTNHAVHPWIQTASATQNITNNQTGVIEFDVTGDVANFLNGTSQNYGWIIKKTNEALSGNVSFGTKESSSVPQLFVTYQP